MAADFLEEAGQQTEKQVISLYDQVARPAERLREARAQAGRRAAARSSLSVYFANVSSWSARAQDYIANRVDAGVVVLVETHVRAGMLDGELSRFDQWGFKASGRAAIGTSLLGSSGGVFTAVRKGLATHSLGPWTS